MLLPADKKVAGAEEWTSRRLMQPFGELDRCARRRKVVRSRYGFCLMWMDGAGAPAAELAEDLRAAGGANVVNFSETAAWPHDPATEEYGMRSSGTRLSAALLDSSVRVKRCSHWLAHEESGKRHEGATTRTRIISPWPQTGQSREESAGI